MTETARRDKLDAIGMLERFGPNWTVEPCPTYHPDISPDDSWWFNGPGGIRVMVSYDPDSEPGVEWVHASCSYAMLERFPTYNDLKRMHHGVFGDGHAYQAFVPASQHINIRSNVLHLWGKLDGSRVLPDFGREGTI